MRLAKLILIGLLLPLSGCSGDRVAESWFAPDPRLKENPNLFSLSSQPSPVVTPSPSSVSLPDNFPMAIPRYPQAQLVAVKSESSQEGETQWESKVSPSRIANFYQTIFKEEQWQIITPLTDDRGDLVVQRDNLKVILTLLNPGGQSTATRFTIAYQKEAKPLPSPSPSSSPSPPSEPSPSPTASPIVITSIEGYIQDLIALGVIPDSPQKPFQPTQNITRREFARWLFAAHNKIYGDRPTKQIRPIPTPSQPAYQDLKPADPDFPLIQGLAEAGLIPSRLTGETAALLFQPEAILTRENLILWKVPLDLRSSLAPASVGAIEKTWGFKDTAQINPKVLPFLLADYENGDNANVLRAFGYTTLFQPKKPVTRAEAAAALWYFGYQGEGISAREALKL